MKNYIEELEIKLENSSTPKGKKCIEDELLYEKERCIQILDKYHLRWSETGVECRKGVCEHEEEIIKQINIILNK